MKIKQIESQHRRDYIATMICEHCDHEQMDNNGYDDAFYHQNVIPKMVCGKCGEKANDKYRPMSTKYPEDMVV